MSEERRVQKKQRIPLFFLILYLIISGFFLSLSSGGFILDFQQIGFSIVSTVQSGTNAVWSGITRFFTSVSELSQLKKEYELLSERLEDYEYLQRNNAEIRKENIRLKELLDFTEDLSYQNYPAQIIGRETNTTYSGITVNKGSRQGIRKGMPVIAIQNGNIGLVGKVITVGLNTSMIMPVYDSRCNVSARIEHTRDTGIISGTGAESAPLSLSYIKKRVLEELSYGDVIVTSGENDNYMSDIPIGTISAITVLDYDTSLEITVIPVIDFGRLEHVVIVDVHSPEDY